MKFPELIDALGKVIGVELTPEDGSVMLEIDEMPVVIRELVELDAVVLMGPIGEPPPERQEQLLKALLDANHLFAGTGGGTLSRDPETGIFHLCRMLPLALTDTEAFSSALERFVNVVETWRKLIADYRPVAEIVTKESAADDSSFGSGEFMRV